MIVNEYKQGTHTIKIESATTLEDDKKHNFPNGVYSRYFIDGKKVDNYNLLIKFIIAEAKDSGNNLLNDPVSLTKQRDAMFRAQHETMKKTIEDVRKQYKDMGIPADVLYNVDEILKKIDASGVRVVE